MISLLCQFYLLKNVCVCSNLIRCYHLVIFDDISDVYTLSIFCHILLTQISVAIWRHCVTVTWLTHSRTYILRMLLFKIFIYYIIVLILNMVKWYKTLPWLKTNHISRAKCFGLVIMHRGDFITGKFEFRTLWFIVSLNPFTNYFCNETIL